MKKLVPILITILILALLGFGIYFLANNIKSTKFTLVKESGSIFYKEKTASDYTELYDEEINLEAGTFVKTDAESYGRIFLPDNSLISLDEKTEVQITFADNKADIQQLVGKTWHRVQSVTKGGEYKVQTPNTIAAVRGTIFGVGVDDKDNSRVFVEESNVDVNKYELQNNNVNILETQNLGIDESAEIKRDTQSFRIIRGKLADELKSAFWYRRNKILDEEYNKIKGERRNLIKLLQERLQSRQDYQTLKLGLRPLQTIRSKIQDELADVFDLSNITERTCSQNSQDKIQNAIDQLKRYRTYVNRSTELINLLTTLKGYCRDGVLSVDEAKQLEVLVKAVNQ